ncbi:M16 family metallopeptidase [Chryseobacterium sp. PTM-20240506]|uniref:M16 family metallopeptidase n=1 Tax=unclassified Chryseobacterium TaxID=2593645 RepID=UPI002359F67A|nr:MULTISPECIES: pitrilysin family protein [unclassified Chryseobacterium]MDC8105619.1 insulinase family protein [Chryseobacterium sp. B21-037]MDQ1806356.1 pitrilysin family protein [Chryseobacterium sp. CKR4-1]
MKNLLLGTAVLFFTGTINPVFSQSTETPKFIGNTEGIKEYTLNNGMKVLLIPDPSQSNMVVNIVYNVGSKDEGYGEKGMAHLLEHMLFKSTKNLGDIKKQLSDKGGQANGTTWYDRTNYYEIFPSNEENLKWSLQMEADRMINATILQSDLDKEFSVVRNEFEIGENNPTRVMMQNVFSNGYVWHNYGNSTIGSKEDIERVKAPTLRKFYEKYYQPDNATLIVAGKFDEKSALKYISDYFSVIKKPSRELGGTYTVEPAQNGEKYFEIKRNNDQQIIAAGYHTSAYADKDYAALSALYEILTSNPSGYLYKTLVETQKVSGVWTFSPVLRDPGMVYFNFDVPKDKNLDETTKLVRAELDKISSIQFTQDDLKRAKAKLIKDIENQKNNTINFAINLTEIIGAGNYKLNFLYRDHVENLKLEDISKVAQKYFKNNNRTMGVFRPSPNEERVFPTEFRDNQIADLVKDYKGRALEKEPAPFEASIANIKKNLTEGKLSNGMKYGLINKELKGEKIQANFRLRIGNEKDLQGKEAIGNITASLLKSGTKTRTKEQIKDELDQMKSSVYAYVYDQNLIIGVNTYKQYYSKVMAIVQDILTNSTFPENEIAKTITEVNTQLEGQLKDPQAIAGNELQRLASPYPKTSIFYVASLQEQIDENKKVTKAQIVDFYQNIMGASNGVGTVIGNIDPKIASSELEKTFGKFTAKSKFVEVKPTFFETKKQDKNIITPDKENAVALGTSSFKMSQDHPDYPALVMANEILGSGGFLSARLPMRLREKEGISYGVGSYLDVPVSNDVASWNYYAFLNPTKRNAVEAAIKEEINKALASGFTQEELDSNKKSYANERKTSLGSDGTLVNLVNTQLLFGVSLDKFDEQNTKIQNLKLSEVNAALKKYLSENNIISVFAGDFNKK